LVFLTARPCDIPVAARSPCIHALRVRKIIVRCGGPQAQKFRRNTAFQKKQIFCFVERLRVMVFMRLQDAEMKSTEPVRLCRDAE
ncbi:MAG: hypothetical protein KKH95_06365, partial [Gammaproteobacteria bacterium]|nr:hypothetical protein [Gammaproteobacteria bacterium]